MKISKTLISLFLALMMMFTALPFTAFAADNAAADTGAESDIAETGDRIFHVSNAKDMIDSLRINDTENVVQVIVDSDFNANVGTAGDNSDANYIPILCTIGQGKKVLNLNGHALNFRSDYTCIYNGYENGEAYLEAKNNECLFSVPSGAELEVNGRSLTDSGVYGSVKYDGVVLYKCDAIDQRDIFHVDGGKLIVNSGNFLAPTQSQVIMYNYKNDEIFPVNGTAVTLNSGSLIINGGYFEGRGQKGYRCRIITETGAYGETNYSNYNGALEINSSVPTAEINGGHFCGVFHACPVRMVATNNVVFRAGRFTTDGNDKETLITKYGALEYYTDDPGYCGIILNSFDDDKVYYTYNEAIPSLEPFTAYNNADTVYALRKEFFIAPKTAKSGIPGYPDEDNKDLQFWRNGAPYDSTYTTDEEWKIDQDFIIDIFDQSFYYPEYLFTEYSRKDIAQTVTGTVSIHRFISEGNRPLVIGDLPANIYKEDGMYKLNLKDVIPADQMSKFKKDELYVLDFSVDEEYKNANGTQTVTHRGWYYIMIDTRPGVIGEGWVYLDELPMAGHRPCMTAYIPGSGEHYTVEEVYWAYNGAILDPNAGLIADQYYDVYVCLLADEGYRFSKGPVGYINGRKAKVDFLDSPERTRLRIKITIKCPDGLTGLETAITEPKAGKYPSYSARVPDDVKYAVEDFTGGNYFKNGVQWYNISDKHYIDPDSSEKFNEGDRYQVIISLVTTDNTYRFSTSDRHAYVNGNETTFTPFIEDTQLHNVYVLYTFTVGDLDATITEVSASVTEPVVGFRPDSKVTVPPGRGYSVSGNAIWKNSKGQTIGSSSTFTAGINYTVSFELVADEDHRFSPQSDLSAYVNGENAQIIYTDRNHVTLSRTFTCSDFMSIHSVMATVNPPEDEECPDQSPSTDSSLYQVSLSKWINLSTGKEMAEDDRFAEGNRYRCILRFDVGLGKMFDANAKCFINGETAEADDINNFTAYFYKDFYLGDQDVEILKNVACTIEEPKGGKPLCFNAVSADPDKYSIRVNYWQDRTAGGNINSNTDVTAVVGHEYRVYVTYVMNDDRFYADTTAAHYVNEKLAAKGSNALQYYVSFTCNTEAPTYTVQALVTSFLDMNEDLEVTLLRANGTEADSTSVRSGDMLVVFNNVVEGDYIMRVEKKNHATRDYPIVVDGTTDFAFQINPIGDIDGDGDVTTFDYAQCNAHAKGVRELKDYAFVCANVAGGDDEVTTLDAASINAHAKGARSLWK